MIHRSGDTKVAGKGRWMACLSRPPAWILEGVNPAGANAEPGDKIIVTETLAVTVVQLLERTKIRHGANVTSDCAPLWNAVNARAATRHRYKEGCDARRSWVVALWIADQSDVGIKLDTESIPVNRSRWCHRRNRALLSRLRG